MTSDTSSGPDQMEEGVHAWTSPCNPDPLKPGVKLMAGCNSAGVGVTSVSLPVVSKPARGTQRFCVRRVGILDNPSFQILCPQVLEC